MKKFSSIVFYAVAVAAALVSCKKEVEVPVEQEEQISEGIQVTLMADEITKTYIEGKTPKWKATDAIGVFTGNDHTNQKFTNTRADGEKAVFTGTVPSEGKYYAYYPYPTNPEYTGATEEGALVKVPETQYPTPTSFDGAADLLLSEGFEVAGGTNNLSIKFRRLAAFLKFSFTDETSGKVLSGEYATKVTVMLNVDPETDSRRFCPVGRVTPEGFTRTSGGMRSINAVYDANVYEFTADNQFAYFGIIPQTFAKDLQFIVTVETNKRTITKTLTMPKDIELGAGQILPLTVKITNSDLPVKVEKLWQKVSTGSTSWMTTLSASGTTGTAGADRNVAIDGDNVYIAEFASTKNLWAINIADPTDISLLPTTSVASTGNSNIHLACPRVIKKVDGSPVLMVCNLGGNDNEPNLYVYDNGIDNEPKTVVLSNGTKGVRIGDTFTVTGTYDDQFMCIFGKSLGGNGFVTFLLNDESTKGNLKYRYGVDTPGFSNFYPFPGQLTRGIFAKRDIARALYLTVSNTENDLWGSLWGPTSGTTVTNLNYSQGLNGATQGYNFIEFGGKRYIIYAQYQDDSTASGSAKLIIRSGSIDTDWLDILGLENVNTGDLSPVYTDTIMGSMGPSNAGLDVAVWQDTANNEVYIAMDMQNAGLAVYKMSQE